MPIIPLSLFAAFKTSHSADRLSPNALFYIFSLTFTLNFLLDRVPLHLVSTHRPTTCAPIDQSHDRIPGDAGMQCSLLIVLLDILSWWIDLLLLFFFFFFSFLYFFFLTFIPSSSFTLRIHSSSLIPHFTQKMIFQSSDPEPLYPVVDIYHYLESNPFNVQPGKTVFIDPTTEKALTFGQFQLETKHFAAGLQDSYGFQPKDVLAIFSYNQVLHTSFFLCYSRTLCSPPDPFFCDPRSKAITTI